MFLKLAGEEPSGGFGSENFINLDNVLNITYHYYGANYFNNGESAYEIFFQFTNNETLKFIISEKNLFKTLEKIKINTEVIECF